MPFRLPTFTPPDFEANGLASAPSARFEQAPADGVAPEGFHATSNHPEYVHLGGGDWMILRGSRMDCVVVFRRRKLHVVEPRFLKKGDPVLLGRTENGEDGIFVHTRGFAVRGESAEEKFAFRTFDSREASYSGSYDSLYGLLRHDREQGYIVWVLGPAVVFDKDSRDAMAMLIRGGYCHALLAGNALATHDLEAAYFRTGLGQDIYTRSGTKLGHYHHLDVLNQARRAGSIRSFIEQAHLTDGILCACLECGVPWALAGSIRDDGPLPDVLGDACAAQDAMRRHARRATTVLCLATALHAIAFGNMVPGYRVMAGGAIRPVYLYVVDMSEFSTTKLANRGSTQAVAILTNVQDFLVNLRRNLADQPRPPAGDRIAAKRRP